MHEVDPAITAPPTDGAYTQARRVSVWLALATTLALLFNTAARAQDLCYSIADSDKITSSDELIAVNPLTGVSFSIGSLGTLDVEAAVLSLDGTVLYAADGGQLGSVDLGTGAYTALGSPFGTADGAGGAVLLSDVDSLSFDPTTGLLYGVHRTTGASTPDLLFRIDPVSGAHVADAFGAGIDYLEIAPILGLESIDDIAVHPLDGQMFAIANDDPTGYSDRLVRLDKATGVLTDVGPFGVIDVEGLTFDAAGNLYASTGSDSTFAARDRLFSIDAATGTATEIAPLLGLFTDYEALTCHTPARPAALGNYVWLDENSDGRQDAGEAGLANVTVELYSAGLTPGVDPPTDTRVTDTQGGYLFADLGPGDYQVRVDPASLPAGLTQTANPVLPGADGGNQSQPYGITLAAGDENLTADFGYNWNPDGDVDGNTGNATLGDRVWLDADGDGAQDPGEAGAPGVLVNLVTAGPDGLFGTPDDVTAATATTDATGAYLFDGLAPDAYAVVIDPTNFDPGGALENAVQSGDPDHFGTNDPGDINDNRTTDPILLGPGDVFLNADFGYQPPAAQDNQVGDTVWLDADGDGLIDAGEPGIPGVTLALVADDGDGLFDPANPGADVIVATTTTDADGLYLFDGLPDGNYVVWVNDTANVLAELVQSGDPDALLDDQSATDLDSAGADPAGVVDLGLDFGYTPPGQDPGEGVIGDTVFLDQDGDGAPDPGEGLEGVRVELRDAGGNLIAVTVTDENGTYVFGGLDPTATYTVTVDPTTLPPGLVNTVDPDDDGTDGNGDEDGESTVDLAASGGVDLDQDFGYEPAGVAGTIGNQIWFDSDADGLFTGPDGSDGLPGTDDDEPGLEGVSVDLYVDLDSDGQLDPGEPRLASTLTDADGLYLFAGLPVDDGSGGDVSYLVDVTDTAGVLAGTWHSIGPDAGDGVSDNNSQSSPYGATLSGAAPNHLLADFGYYAEAAALGNRVFLDVNGNGLQDAGEPGIPDAVVTLSTTYPDGTVTTLDTVTAADGSYRFGNLLLDEDFDGDGTPGAGGDEPLYVISVATPAGLSPTLLDQGGDDLVDADDPAGVNAAPQQGLSDVALQADPGTEGDPASYDFGFIAQDFGDAPDPTYPTLLASNGARHLIGSGLTLGANIDAEIDGQPTPGADGDDIAGIPDDEDGVAFPAAPLLAGNPAGAVSVTASAPGLLDAWIDFNQDGDWNDPGEQIFASQAVVAGANALTFAVPAGAAEGTTVTRFRLSSGGGLPPTGFASDGEVEDHLVAIVLPAALGDFVWEDVDGDGIQDGFEPGLGGVTVDLLLPDLTPVASTTTAPDGSYSFTDLVPGDYVVAFTPPAGFTISPQDQGGDDTLDSDANPATGVTGTVTLASGETNNTIDAGLIAPATEAVIDGFRAWDEGGKTIVEWHTSSEIGTAGFDLLRWDGQQGQYKRVNPRLLPGLMHRPQGGTYRLADEVAAFGERLTYLLVETEVSARRVLHGPFTVRVEAPSADAPTGLDTYQAVARSQTRDQRRRLSLAAAEHAAATEDRGRRIGRALKIAVESDGLYSVSAAEIAPKLGLPEEHVRERISAGRLALTHRGHEIAYEPTADGLLFYGRAIDSPYARHNVYWLGFGAGQRMVREDGGSPTAAQGTPVFTTKARFEEDLLPAIQLPVDPESDYWFWESVNGGHPSQSVKTFNLGLEGVVPGTRMATLHLTLHGATQSGVENEHHAELSLNGQPLGSMIWSGIERREGTFDVPMGLLRNGNNTLEVRGLLGPGVFFSLFYVDAVELEHERTYRAHGPELFFEVGEQQVVTVEGLTSPHTWLLDVSDARRPRVVDGGTLETTSDGYRLSFRPQDGRRFLAVAPEGVREVSELWADKPSELRNERNAADYVIVTAAPLREATEAFAALRTADGLTVLIAELEDIMDEHNHGIFDPWAVRDFLAEATERWRQGPRFALLAGAGSYDYRDLLGQGGNLIPALMARTHDGLFASDSRYADFDADGRPDIALGRLPVLTADELRAYVEKLAASEGDSGAWRGRALMVTDNPDAGGNFPADGERLARQLQQAFEVAWIDLSSRPLADARHELFEDLGSGVRLMTYLGHGGLDRLADEGLLKTSDVPDLAGGRLPAIAGMTCAINRFAIPGFSSLGEALVTHEQAGAAAVWAPSGLSSHPQAVRLAESLLAAINQGMTFGEAVRHALDELATNGGSEHMLAIYNLLGDPALGIRAEP